MLKTIAGCFLSACGNIGRVAGLALISACASTPTVQPREVLDESSASTLLIVQHPIVFARSRTDVAAHARDYVTLVGTQEDRSGKYSTWLVVHRWSTVDPRMAGDAGVGAGPLRIIADDRELTFNPTVPPPALLQRGELLFGPRHARSQSAAYAVDPATLRYLASAQTLSLRYDDDVLPLAYTLWDDGRAALQALLAGAAP